MSRSSQTKVFPLSDLVWIIVHALLTIYSTHIGTGVQRVKFDAIQIVTVGFLEKNTFWKLVENINFLERICAVIDPKHFILQE
jgi:hypothetical protein